MTIASTISKLLYNGDGSTTAFAVSFVFWQNADIKAILRDANGVETTWVEGTQYTLTGGAGSTGTLTVETTPTDYTPASGEKLLIKSELPETQGAALPLGGAFPSTTVEQMVDIVTRLVQQHSEEIARSVVLPETASLSGMTFPEPGAGEIIRYNAGGTDLETIALASLSLSALDTVLSGLANGNTLEYDAAQSAWVNIASDFKVSAQITPDMTVRAAAGEIFDATDGTRVSQVAQNTATLVAPTTDPRIDIVYIDRLAATIGVEEGSEAASPVEPALTLDKVPLSLLAMTVGMTEITASDITDIRALGLLGAGELVRFNRSDIQGQTFTAFNDTGAADAYVITPVPAITAYAKYQAWVVDIANANTGASTMNISGLGTRNIFDYRTGAALTGGEIIAGLHRFADDGTQLILMNPASVVTPGVSGIELVRKASDETVNNSTTLQNDDELLASLAVNEQVFFELTLSLDTGTTPDIKFAFTVPSGAALRWNTAGGILISPGGAGPVVSNDVTASGTSQAHGGSGAGTPRQVTLSGIVVNGANAGNLRLQWAQSTADVSDTKVLAGAALIVWRL